MSICMAILLIFINCGFVFSNENVVDEREYLERNEFLESNGNQIIPVTTGSAFNPLLGYYDDTPPVLVDISIDKTNIEAPGTIIVTATATDDLSGIDVGLGAQFENGSRYYYVYLYNKYYDNNTNQTVTLPANKYQGVLTIDTYDNPGTYTLEKVYNFEDKAGNRQQYYRNPTQYQIENGALPLPNELSFKVNNTNYDDSPPVLVDISIDKTNIEAPGTIIVTATATDDLSGIDVGLGAQFENGSRYYYVYLYNKYYDNNTNQTVTLPANKYQGVLTIDTYDNPGTYTLEKVYNFEDKAGNRQQYYRNPTQYQIENGALPLPNELSFKVNNTNYDNIPPVLVDIGIDKTNIEAPGKIIITATATDNLSGIDGGLGAQFENGSRYYYVHLYNQYYDNNTNQTVTLPANKYQGILIVGAYDNPGTYTLEKVYNFEDKAGNRQRYYRNPTQYEIDNGALILPNELTFTITNDKPVNLATNTNNPNLAQDIAAQPNNAVILVNYDTASQINTNIFDAIKGTDKTLVLQGNGIEWVFNGKDIDNPKNIDVNVEINKISNYYGSSADNLEDIVKDVPTIVLSFAENGKLPRKAKIRIKADYTFRNYLGTQNLYVYYYDNTYNKLIPVAVSLNVSERDSYLEFEIEHNSDFIITKGEVPLTPKAG